MMKVFKRRVRERERESTGSQSFVLSDVGRKFSNRT